MKIVIRAGGVGTRLWPYSRQKKPKQLYPLVSDKTMLAETIERAEKLAPIGDIYISMGGDSAEETKKYCLGVPRGNIIIEPVRRDTAAAVGLESLHIAYNDPEAIVVGFAADHLIRKPKEFVKVVEAAVEAVRLHPESIMAIGIRPTEPHTGYGYIERSTELGRVQGTPIYTVRSFREKPDAKTAEEFLKAGTYLWNANIFVWKVSTILQLFAQHQPQMFESLEKIGSSIGTEHYEQTVLREYPKMDTIAVEHAIIEKASKLLTMEADIGWNDIGDWASVAHVQAVGKDGNIVKGTHLGRDTSESIIYGKKDKLIATIGLENMVVVDTDDVLLICPKNRSQEVKALVEQIKRDGLEQYL